MMQIGIIGLGLMGCSLGLAIQKYIPGIKIAGYDLDDKHLKYACKNNIIDICLSDCCLQELDIIFIAVPIRSVIDVLKRFQPRLNLAKTLVTDMGSTKSYLNRKIKDQFPEIKYIGGHPIAGREVSGPRGAISNLFKNSNYILIKPDNNKMDAELEKLRTILAKIGCKVSFLTPEEHDRLLAFSSHLPQILATILINELNMIEDKHPEISELIGTGFLDMTRIAASDSEMWLDIFLTNKDSIVNRIDSLLRGLIGFKEMIQNEDEKIISEIMNKSRQKRLSLKGEKYETENNPG